jgi:hypothetical protein
MDQVRMDGSLKDLFSLLKIFATSKLPFSKNGKTYLRVFKWKIAFHNRLSNLLLLLNSKKKILKSLRVKNKM